MLMLESDLSKLKWNSPHQEQHGEFMYYENGKLLVLKFARFVLSSQ